MRKMKGLRRYKPADYDMIADWYLAWEMRPPTRRDLSDQGYIYNDRVAGWLYTTDSSVAMIEGIVADKNMNPAERNKEVRALVGFLLDYAATLGYTNVVALTNHPSSIQICNDFGFEEMNKRAFMLRLDEDEDEEYLDEEEMEIWGL